MRFIMGSYPDRYKPPLPLTSKVGSRVRTAAVPPIQRMERTKRLIGSLMARWKRDASILFRLPHETSKIDRFNTTQINDNSRLKPPHLAINS